MCAQSCGVRVKELVGDSPDFDNADYLFRSDNVVAELKSLRKDYLLDLDIKEEMDRSYNRWVDDGKVPPIYGELIVRTDQIPLDCRQEIIALFKKRFKRRLAKANKQIGVIKQRLGCSDAIGLLLLSNDNNFALDPAMTAHILHHSLELNFSQIEHVILFSANLTVRVPGSSAGNFPFYSVRFCHRRTPAEEFLNRLGSCWSEVLRGATGRDLSAFSRLPFCGTYGD